MADGPGRRRAAAAAQGRPLRAAGARQRGRRRGRARRASYSATTRSCCCPTPTCAVDAVEFRRRADRALAAGTEDEAEAALAAYAGPLLPEDLYEPWTADWRDTVVVLHRDLLRQARRWADLVREDPADESAHLALAREYAELGDARAAQRQLERMEQALRRELGTVPSAEAPAAARRAGLRWRGGRGTVAGCPSRSGGRAADRAQD